MVSATALALRWRSPKRADGLDFQPYPMAGDFVRKALCSSSVAAGFSRTREHLLFRHGFASKRPTFARLIFNLRIAVFSFSRFERGIPAQVGERLLTRIATGIKTACHQLLARCLPLRDVVTCFDTSPVTPEF